MTPLLSSQFPAAVISSVAKLNLDLHDWQHNPRIGAVLSDTVLKGGKRLRPFIAFLVSDLFNVEHVAVAPFARVVELVHASTLAHDDVIDNATVRRGEPSINVVESNKRAVLAGDYLLAYCLDTVSQQGNPRIVRELARMISDLAEGEWLQLENAENPAPTRADIERVALKKTGSVLRWCCLVPAILAEASALHQEMAQRLGETLGIAFQITDDILDCERPDAARLADFKNGVINSIVFELIAQGELKKTAPDVDNLSPAALQIAIKQVRVRLAELIAEARTLVQTLAQELEQRHGRPTATAVGGLNQLISFIEYRV